MASLTSAATRGYSARMAAAPDNDRQEEGRLVGHATRGDTKAFEALYRLHIDKVYGLCLRMTGNVGEAEDCAQEAFIQAWKKLNRFRGDSAFATWLHRIAVNTVLGRIRKSKREQDRIQEAAEVNPPPAALENDGHLRDLSAAIDRLPERARHVFVLHAVYGYSHEETGNMLDIAVGTSKAQLHRARRLLTQQLDAEGYER